MEILSKYISDEFLYSVGWTIFHSIWIGALISLLLFVALVFLGKSSAKTRYNISMTAMIILVTIVSAVFIRTLDSAGHKPVNLSSISELLPEKTSPAIPDIGEDISRVNINTGISKKIISFLNSNYNLISLLWMAGIVFMFIRFSGGLFFSGKLSRSNTGNVISKYSALINKISCRIGLERKVKIVESFIARVPMTSGWLKPVIYIPIGALTGLPYNQIEAVIAHELAHIKRNDYLVNLFQSLIEIILFYHPAIWWISSVIRSERESACDDIAVELSDEKLTYIKALVSISEFESGTTGAAVAFAGDNSNLLNRIKRIAKMKKGKINKTDKWTSALMSLVVLTGVIILTGFRAEEPGIDESSTPLTNITELSGALEQPGPITVYSTQEDTIRISGTITRTITDPVDGEEKDFEFTFENGKLSAMSIDGKEIPESDFHLYKNETGKAKKELADVIIDMEEALVDIEEAMEEIEDIDMEEIEKDIQEALSDIEDLDIEEMEFEIQEALEEIKELEIEDIEIDIEKILQDVEESLMEIEEIDIEEIELEMQRAMEEIKEIDFEKIRLEMQESIEGLEDINIEKIMQEMEESMQEIQESLNDLNIDQRNTIETQRNQFETQKKELEKRLIELQEGETKVEKQKESEKKKKEKYS